MAKKKKSKKSKSSKSKSWSVRTAVIIALAAGAVAMSFTPLISSTIVAHAAVTGFQSPTDTDAQNEWNNASRAYTSNNSYASTDNDDDDQGYDEFGGFTVTAGSTINGILAEIDARQEGTTCQLLVRLSWNNGSNFTSYKTLVPTGSETTLSYGSSADTWGHTWTINELSNANFVLEMRYNDATPGNSDNGCDSNGSSRDSIEVDHIRVKVYYTPANVAPVAQADSVSVQEDGSVNDSVVATDSDGPSALVYSFVAPAHGLLTSFNTATGAFTYQPFANYNGPDSFTFKAYDGSDYSNTATISITVDSVNDLPEITLAGANPINLIVGDTYTEPGATANDVEDGSNLTVTNITGSVDTGTVGSYTVFYNFTDSQGGVAVQKTRTVNVGNPPSQCQDGIDNDGDELTDLDDLGCSSAEDNSENQTPVIVLNGTDPVVVTLGGTYSELGAVANDAEDGNGLTVSNITGTVDTNTVGSYVISYNFSDMQGAAASAVTRTVEVKTACSDGIDNDSDELTDLADTGCSDANDNDETTPVIVDVCPNIEGVQSEVPSGMELQEGDCVASQTNNDDDTPPADQPASNNGGGGGGVIVSGPLSIGFVNTNTNTEGGGLVLGASTDLPASCTPYLTGYVGKGGNPELVKKLQNFLNKELDLSLIVDGIFGLDTKQAVKDFQLKYWDQILKPWVPHGLPSDHTPTGFVYKTTTRMINLLQCSSLDLPMPQLP